jgi:hypothetical protein
MGLTPSEATSSRSASTNAATCAAGGRAPPRRKSQPVPGSRSRGMARGSPAPTPSPSPPRQYSPPGRGRRRYRPASPTIEPTRFRSPTAGRLAAPCVVGAQLHVQDPDQPHRLRLLLRAAPTHVGLPSILSRGMAPSSLSRSGASKQPRAVQSSAWPTSGSGTTCGSTTRSRSATTPSITLRYPVTASDAPFS